MSETQTRVEDYLDDQIQTVADLDRINALLARVEEQRNVLQTQVGAESVVVLIGALISYSSKKLSKLDSKQIKMLELKLLPSKSVRSHFSANSSPLTSNCR